MTAKQIIIKALSLGYYPYFSPEGEMGFASENPGENPVPSSLLRQVLEHRDEFVLAHSELVQRNGVLLTPNQARDLRELARESYKPAEPNPHYPAGYENPQERARRREAERAMALGKAQERAQEEGAEFDWEEDLSAVRHGKACYHFDENGVCSCQFSQFKGFCKHAMERERLIAQMRKA